MPSELLTIDVIMQCDEHVGTAVATTVVPSSGGSLKELTPNMYARAPRSQTPNEQCDELQGTTLSVTYVQASYCATGYAYRETEETDR